MINGFYLFGFAILMYFAIWFQENSKYNDCLKKTCPANTVHKFIESECFCAATPK